MQTRYDLKRYRTSKSPDLIKALKLYSENIEPSYRTDANEILFWIDNFEKRFGDLFIVCGLYLNDALIGYGQLAYFKEEKFVEVDYLVIDKNYRKNNAFYEFVDKIGDLLSEENIIFDYIICEVGCYFENREPTEASKTLIRLLKMSHFGVIKCSYYVPRLGKSNHESEMRAILMIYSNDDIKQIKKETYLMVINTLFYKYYQRWYADFFTEAERTEYKIDLDGLSEAIQKELSNKKVIDINGYHNLLPLNPTDFGEIKAKKGIKIITFITLFVCAIILFGGAAIYIKERWDLEFENQSAILLLSVLAASIITTIIFNNKSNLPSKLVEKLIDKI